MVSLLVLLLLPVLEVVVVAVAAAAGCAVFSAYHFLVGLDVLVDVLDVQVFLLLQPFGFFAWFYIG